MTPRDLSDRTPEERAIASDLAFGLAALDLAARGWGDGVTRDEAKAVLAHVAALARIDGHFCPYCGDPGHSGRPCTPPSEPPVESRKPDGWITRDDVDHLKPIDPLWAKNVKGVRVWGSRQHDATVPVYIGSPSATAPASGFDGTGNDPYPGTLCPECGPNVDVDEDGCCLTCGGNATGAWLSSYTLEGIHFVRNEVPAPSERSEAREEPDERAIEGTREEQMRAALAEWTPESIARWFYLRAEQVVEQGGSHRYAADLVDEARRVLAHAKPAAPVDREPAGDGAVGEEPTNADLSAFKEWVAARQAERGMNPPMHTVLKWCWDRWSKRRTPSDPEPVEGETEALIHEAMKRTQRFPESDRDLAVEYLRALTRTTPDTGDGE